MMRRAPLWRRFIRSLLWLLAGVTVLTATVFAGLISLAPFRPPADWFWTEWLLRAWLDEPLRVLAPLLVIIVSSTILETIAVWFSADPTLRWLNLEIVDCDGFAPAWWQYLLRFLGTLLSWASLGLGFAWAWVSRHGRSLEDLVSKTALVLDQED